MIEITELARAYIIETSKKFNSIGISVDAVKGGCSGMQFKFAVEHSKPAICEAILIEEEVYFFIIQSALLFIVGSTLEYQKTMTGALLVFKKANMKGTCGCGKSFY